MAGNGKTSGDGKTSPFGSPGGGASSGGNDFVANPSPATGGGGNNFVEKPEGGGESGGANNFVEKPGGDDMVPAQKTGTYRNPTSVPAGGPTPFVKGGATPPADRTAPKSGFGVGSAPEGGPNRKPFKVSSR